MVVAANSKEAVNGGQLHAAKTELNNNINNAKTELNIGDAKLSSIKILMTPKLN